MGLLRALYGLSATLASSSQQRLPVDLPMALS
jgi:hypothetical protein